MSPSSNTVTTETVKNVVNPKVENVVPSTDVETKDNYSVDPMQDADEQEQNDLAERVKELGLAKEKRLLALKESDPDAYDIAMQGVQEESDDVRLGKIKKARQLFSKRFDDDSAAAELWDAFTAASGPAGFDSGKLYDDMKGEKHADLIIPPDMQRDPLNPKSAVNQFCGLLRQAIRAGNRVYTGERFGADYTKKEERIQLEETLQAAKISLRPIGEDVPTFTGIARLIAERFGRN